MPWLANHFPVFNSLVDIDWRWHIVEGAANNVKDTKWCRKPQAGASTDGTFQFMAAIDRHPRVKVYHQPIWQGKVEMMNAPLIEMRDDAILLQVDSDEFWTAEKIRGIVRFFEAYPNFTHARFFCNYFLGPNVVAVGENSYGNKAGEWLRAWRYKPGMQWVTHEPPNLAGNIGEGASRETTLTHGLIFDHYAYVLDSQVAFKEKYYGYENMMLQWKILQITKKWPVKLKSFLRWADDDASAKNLYP